MTLCSDTLEPCSQPRMAKVRLLPHGLVRRLRRRGQGQGRQAAQPDEGGAGVLQDAPGAQPGDVQDAAGDRHGQGVAEDAPGPDAVQDDVAPLARTVRGSHIRTLLTADSAIVWCRKPKTKRKLDEAESNIRRPLGV